LIDFGFLSKRSGPEGTGFDLPQEKATKPPDPISPVTAQHSTVCYQVVENMNRRTAEQETAECRSEKHCIIPSKNFCCSKFLVRYSIFNPLCGTGPEFLTLMKPYKRDHKFGILAWREYLWSIGVMNIWIADCRFQI
jgi:hypothetical protein